MFRAWYQNASSSEEARANQAENDQVKASPLTAMTIVDQSPLIVNDQLCCMFKLEGLVVCDGRSHRTFGWCPTNTILTAGAGRKTEIVTYEM